MDGASDMIFPFDEDSFFPPHPHATSDAWRKSSRRHKNIEIRNALAHQRGLEIAADELKSIAGRPDSQHLNDIVAQVVQSTNGLQKFFSQIACTRLFNERCGAECSGRQVFDIQELLERILSFVSNKDLLHVQQVDRTMYDAIEGSIMLQRKLNLVPSPEGHLYTPFDQTEGTYTSSRKRRKHDRWFEFPGFKCDALAAPWRFDPDTGQDISQKDMVSIVASLNVGPHQRLPVIGTRCRKMLICQPPVYEMHVFPDCCTPNPFDDRRAPPVFPGHPGHVQYSARAYHHFLLPLPPNPTDAEESLRSPDGRDGSPAPRRRTVIPPIPRLNETAVGYVTSSTGLTVGDLYDMAIKTMHNHRTCPIAGLAWHDNEGFVKTGVSFGCHLRLQTSDPYIKLKWPSGERAFWTNQPLPPVPGSPFAEWDQQFGEDVRLMIKYVEAKAQAFKDGAAILTFAEWRESAQAPDEAGNGTEALDTEPSVGTTDEAA